MVDDDDLTPAERVELARLERKLLDRMAAGGELHAEVDELTARLDEAFTNDEFSEQTSNIHQWRRRVAARLHERI